MRVLLLLVMSTAVGGRRFTVEDVKGEDAASLSRALSRAKGVYVTSEGRETARRRPARATAYASLARDTVLVVAFNLGYVRFLENFACHARRLGLKFLAWAAEAEAAAAAARSFACAEADAHCVLYHAPALAEASKLTADHAEFRSEGFNRISHFKLLIVMAILRRNVNVWFSDVDVGFIRDPRPLGARPACASRIIASVGGPSSGTGCTDATTSSSPIIFAITDGATRGTRASTSSPRRREPSPSSPRSSTPP